MSVRRVHREAWFPGSDLIVAVPGCPDDGREYVEIEPDTPVRGMRMVWYSTATHGHRWGHIISEWPLSGEHIDHTWPLDDRALYWVKVVPDEDMPAYLRADDPAAKAAAVMFVSTNLAWLAPDEAIPAQRAGGHA